MPVRKGSAGPAAPAVRVLTAADVAGLSASARRALFRDRAVLPLMGTKVRPYLPLLFTVTKMGAPIYLSP